MGGFRKGSPLFFGQFDWRAYSYIDVPEMLRELPLVPSSSASLADIQICRGKNCSRDVSLTVLFNGVSIECLVLMFGYGCRGLTVKIMW